MNKRMDYRNKTVNKNQIILKRVFKIIIILLINLIAFTPVFVEKYVNYKRDEWETDRNFYGKEINLNEIKVVKNKTNTLTFSLKDLQKRRTNGKTVYILKSNSNRHYPLTCQIEENVYNKYIADCDQFTMYQKVCNVVYQSANGQMNAEIESKDLYFTPKKFSKDELTDIKKSVCKETQDKVFINDENQDNLKYDSEYDDQECELKDFKGQRVCSGYTYSDKNLNINAYVYGKTFVKAGKYDSLYSDAEYYVKDTNTKTALKLKFLNYIVKTYHSDGYLITLCSFEILFFIVVLILTM